MSQTQELLELALNLFKKSPLKRKKYQMISLMIDDLFENKDQQLTCLDLGSDNGVISYLLREKGGDWHSADLSDETVAAIKSLGLDQVEKISDTETPFSNNQFDLIVIVDCLEHIEADGLFVKDLDRILKQGGRLIVNVPRPVNGLLRCFQNLIGQTDQVHGHVRPGYNHQEIQNLLGEEYSMQSYKYYNRCFSVFIDTLIRFAMDLLKGKGGKKGTVVTANDLAQLKKSFKLYSIISPLVNLFVKLDYLVPFLPGNMLVVKLQKD